MKLKKPTLKFISYLVLTLAPVVIYASSDYVEESYSQYKAKEFYAKLNSLEYVTKTSMIRGNGERPAGEEMIRLHMVETAMDVIETAVDDYGTQLSPFFGPNKSFNIQQFNAFLKQSIKDIESQYPHLKISNS